MMNNNEPTQKVASFDLEAYQIFALDVLVTNSSDPKCKHSELRTTVYKKNPDVLTDVKGNNGKKFLSHVDKSFHEFAFSLN